MYKFLREGTRDLGEMADSYTGAGAVQDKPVIYLMVPESKVVFEDGGRLKDTCVNLKELPRVKSGTI